MTDRSAKRFPAFILALAMAMTGLILEKPVAAYAAAKETECSVMAMGSGSMAAERLGAAAAISADHITEGNIDASRLTRMSLPYFFDSEQKTTGEEDQGDGNSVAGSRAVSQEEPGGDASTTASAFTAGQLALVGMGCLCVGILGATMVLLPKRKRSEDEMP